MRLTSAGVALLAPAAFSAHTQPETPAAPTVIDLRALRPYQRVFREIVAPADQWQLRDLINGYDAIVLLPGSKPASRTVGDRGSG